MIRRSNILILTVLFLVACGGGSEVPTPPRGVPPTATSRAFGALPFGDSGTPIPTPEPTDTPAPSPTPGPVFTEYRVRNGDTLGAISAQFDMTVEELMRVNGLTDPHSLQVDQVLKIPTFIAQVGPSNKILPDSEVVYGPAYKTFDIKAFVANYPEGYLASYVETVDGKKRSGAEILQLVAERFSVGPRALLALMELQSSWVTSSVLSSEQIAFPFGLRDGSRLNLYRQAAWAANQINAGYYGKISGRLGILAFTDLERARLAWEVNPGTAAIQNVLSKTASWDDWKPLVAKSGYLAAYEKLFGDPAQYEVKPLIPRNLKQPVLRLPLEDGKQWFLTGGPHAGWIDGSPWAAVDFAPADQAGSCWQSLYWTVAAAPGVVTASENGRVVLDLDGDGFQGTGWALLYMHQATEERVDVGTKLTKNARIGHPSCEGGAAQTSHLHFARLFNGQWIPAGDQKIPLVLSGWTFSGSSQEYDGAMTRAGETRTAENQRLEKFNDIIPDGGE